MSALVPEVGDRYEAAGVVRLLQVVGLERGYKAAGPKSQDRARLRGVIDGQATGASGLVTLDKLAFDDKYRYLGNYLPPVGYTVHKVGAHWYLRTPAGNVHGAPAGARWTEEQALAVARADAGSRASCRAG